uniref:Uncharacterized protein n=1 Tax=Cacopsylla melanoneura TaxID=428564 RepID=A0A8D8TL01_9HEMI
MLLNRDQGIMEKTKETLERQTVTVVNREEEIRVEDVANTGINQEAGTPAGTGITLKKERTAYLKSMFQFIGTIIIQAYLISILQLSLPEKNREYSPVAYLLLALFHLLWNKNDSTKNAKTVIENVQEAMSQIIEKIPKGIAEPSEHTYRRFVYCFESLYIWCKVHFAGWPRGNNQTRKDDWHTHISTNFNNTQSLASNSQESNNADSRTSHS